MEWKVTNWNKFLVIIEFIFGKFYWLGKIISYQEDILIIPIVFKHAQVKLLSRYSTRVLNLNTYIFTLNTYMFMEKIHHTCVSVCYESLEFEGSLQESTNSNLVKEKYVNKKIEIFKLLLTYLSFHLLTF